MHLPQLKWFSNSEKPVVIGSSDYANRVPSAGIEPASPPSEGDILSVELQGRYPNIAIAYHLGNIFFAF